MGFGKDGKGAIIRESQGIDLGALANNTTVKALSQLAIEEDFRIIKSEYHISFEGFTAAEFPIYVGIADNELSVTEIGETFTMDGPLDLNDRENVEKAERPVWVLAQTAGDVYGIIPDSGEAMEKTMRWTFRNNDGWTFFAHNASGATLTTGGVINVRAKHFGVWVT